MERCQVATIFFLLSSLIILGIGIEKQLQERKNLFHCNQNLKMWGIAMKMYRYEHPNYQEKQEIPNWSEILDTYFTGEQFHCPQVKQKTGYFCHDIYIHQYLGHRIARWETIPLVYDGKNSNILFDNDLQNIERRHLGRANILLGNGAVVYDDWFTAKIKVEKP